MQIIRMTFFLPLLFLNCIAFYIDVKLFFCYFSNWTSTLSLLTFGMMLVSAGNLECERKQLDMGVSYLKLNKSTSWKFALLCYESTMAIVAPTTVFYWLISRDEIIGHMQDLGKGEAGYREYVSDLVNIMPAGMMFIDFFICKMTLFFRHVWIQMILTFFCIGMTILGTIFTHGPPIYY
jgi:hypothetical protein